MAHNNGQGVGQVRRSLQMMYLYTYANLPVSVRKWPCKICLTVSFHRRVDLDRHIQQIHLPCWVFCPYPPCEWRGRRTDELQDHLARYGCNQNSTEKEFRIYNVHIILDVIRDAGSHDVIQNAQNWAVHLVNERARELGRRGWIMDPWGR